MAALDLHCLERGACVWAGERLDLPDSFDSEMQEWEEQLQDVQRKIEELYKEVKARRGANEHAPVSSTNHTHLDFTLLPVDTANGYHGTDSCYGTGGEVHSVHPCSERRANLLTQHANALSYHGDYDNGASCNSEAGYHNGFFCPESYQVDGSRDDTLDILNGYLGHGEDFEQRLGKPGAPYVASTRMQRVHCNQEGAKLGPDTGRIGDVYAGEFEEVENRKNRGFSPVGARHVTWKDPIYSQSGCSPSLRQRDGHPPIPTRSTHFSELPQQPDRKCPLMDRKCSSPSVLRKFGAMLQENEGKTLIEDGTVTTVISAEPSKAPTTPVCQRKFGTSRASTHMPVQKCPQDPSGASSQEIRADSRAFPRKLPPASTPRGVVQAGLWGPQGPEPQAECRAVDRTLGGSDGCQGQDCRGLWDCRGLRDGMKWEEQGTAVYSVQQTVREPSPSQGRRSFSRPARPANQRPPSRWANHTPTSKIATPSGPMSRPPSPARKTQQSFRNFSLYTETVIM